MRAAGLWGARGSTPSDSYQSDGSWANALCKRLEEEEEEEKEEAEKEKEEEEEEKEEEEEEEEDKEKEEAAEEETWFTYHLKPRHGGVMWQSIYLSISWSRALLLWSNHERAGATRRSYGSSRLMLRSSWISRPKATSQVCLDIFRARERETQRERERERETDRVKVRERVRWDRQTDRHTGAHAHTHAHTHTHTHAHTRALSIAQIHPPRGREGWREG